jgi:S1-C subfamily serine protease
MDTIVRFFWACLFAINVLAETDVAPCAVFLREWNPSKADHIIGSGFLVRSNATLLIVTAEHVARGIGDIWRLTIPTIDGKGRTVTATNITWRFSSTGADVAVCRVALKGTNVLGQGLPFEMLSSRPNPPSRDIPLTVFGYPLGLGGEGYVSPIARETKAASGFITLPRFDTKARCTFIILQDPSVGGFSGGPVFDTGLNFFAGGRAIAIRDGVSLVGLMHGTLSDKTGGKFAAVVPAEEIVKLLREELESKK